MGLSKGERLEIRLSAGELAAWKAAAPGGNVSAWLRDLAGQELAGKAGVGGPSARRASREEFLAEGGRDVRSSAAALTPAATHPAPVPAADRSVAPAARSQAPAPPATPAPSTALQRPPAAATSTAAPVAECAHPKAERVVRPWGSFCRACGRLLR